VTDSDNHIALTLGGGGARGAYQAGVLRGIARLFPEAKFSIQTGISAGAVNTVHLASHRGTFTESAAALVDLWLSLSPDQVYDVAALPLARNVLRWGIRLASGGHRPAREPMRGMVDTSPLRTFLIKALQPAADGSLPGIAENLARGKLKAVALTGTSYTTGQAVTWIEGRDVELWQRPQRRSEATRLTPRHVMASSALPVLFPAVQVGSEWYGDGGVRLTAPLSPALHLGAHRILTISTRYRRTRAEADQPLTAGYPPPAQVLSVLYNAVFLDLIDEDVLRLQKVNSLLSAVPQSERGGMRVVDMLVLRPSRDLGKLASEFEVQLPRFFRYLTRGLGTQQTRSPDILSLVLFQRDFLERLVELGETDASARAEEISQFLS
jgi:NTE family protein